MCLGLSLADVLLGCVKCVCKSERQREREPLASPEADSSGSGRPEK